MSWRSPPHRRQPDHLHHRGSPDRQHDRCGGARRLFRQKSINPTAGARFITRFAQHDKTCPEVVKAAVASQRGMVEKFFARLAEGNCAQPGITRDTYGEGEKWGHRVLLEHGERIGTQVAATLLSIPMSPSRGAIGLRRAFLSAPISIAYRTAVTSTARRVLLAGLVAIAVLQDLAVRPACDITAMGIRAEESVWFEISYIGSRSALGTLPEGALDAKRIDTGRALAERTPPAAGIRRLCEEANESSIRPRSVLSSWSISNRRLPAGRLSPSDLHRHSRQFPPSQCPHHRPARPCRDARRFRRTG